MVNADVVNAGTSYFSPATFCEFFRVLGRIPCFQNPFKYICNLRINHKIARAAAGEGNRGKNIIA